MKLSIFGKLLLADFGFRVGKKYVQLRKERARENEPKDPYDPYTRAEATALVKAVFDSPGFQQRWDEDPSEACSWALHMESNEFVRTFGFFKPQPKRE